MIESALVHEVAPSLQRRLTSLSEDDDAITTCTMGAGLGDWRRVDHCRGSERVDCCTRSTLTTLGAGPREGARAGPPSQDRRRSIGL